MASAARQPFGWRDRGHALIALDRHGEAATRTAGDVEAADGPGIAAPCDITDRDGVEAALGGLQHIDVLINSAGVFGEPVLEVITAEDHRQMYEVNVVGLFTVTQAAIPRMPDGGKIINIGAAVRLG